MRAAPAGDGRIAAAKALRFQLLREAEAIVVQNAFPIIPLFDYVHSSLVSPRVRDFRTRLTSSDGTEVDNLEDLHPFRDLVVEPRGNGGR